MLWSIYVTILHKHVPLILCHIYVNVTTVFAGYKLWQHFKVQRKLNPSEKINIIQDVTIKKHEPAERMMESFDINQNQEASTSATIETEQLTPDINSDSAASTLVSKNIDSEYSISSLSHSNDQNSTINLILPEANNDLKENTPPSVNLSGNGSKLNVIKSELMGDYLAWPVSPTRKGKRETERFPFAITAKRFQEMHEKKREMQKEEEIKKQERKRKREEVGKTKEAERKKKATNNKQQCKVCNSILKTSYKLRCDECQGLFHKKCIPQSHRDNIPDEKDGDNFLCHICYKEDSESYTSSISPEEDEPYEYETEQPAKDIEGVAKEIHGIVNKNKTVMETYAEEINEENEKNYAEEDTDILWNMYKEGKSY